MVNEITEVWKRVSITTTPTFPLQHCRHCYCTRLWWRQMGSAEPTSLYWSLRLRRRRGWWIRELDLQRQRKPLRNLAPRPSKAMTPRGKGLVMMPTMVVRKIARSYHAFLVTPVGRGTNQRILPFAIDASRGFIAAPCHEAMKPTVVVAAWRWWKCEIQEKGEWGRECPC